jgi:hypothetical protein
MGILKVWDPLINHITTNLKGLILNIKIDKAIEYIMLNTLKGDFHPFAKKSKYFVKWTTNC